MSLGQIVYGFHHGIRPTDVQMVSGAVFPLRKEICYQTLHAAAAVLRARLIIDIQILLIGQIKQPVMSGLTVKERELILSPRGPHSSDQSQKRGQADTPCNQQGLRFFGRNGKAVPEGSQEPCTLTGRPACHRLCSAAYNPVQDFEGRALSESPESCNAKRPGQ